MKRFLFSLLSVLLMLPVAAQADGLRIAVASDVHLLSPDLVEDQGGLLRIIAQADGKVTHYTPQIAAAFVDEMLALRPDAVILSGDLTLNGGHESHRDLIALLEPLRQAGIPVLVIPGNHDCTGKAYRFTDHGAQPVVGATEADFRAAYAAFGPEEALSVDEASFSYVYPLSPDLRVLMLDTNTAQAPNAVKDATWDWLEAQLREAAQIGARVIAVTHQNLLLHFDGFAAGFQINNADRLSALFARYGVALSLSGHMHLQHIGQTEALTEIATSALAVWPHHYGLVTIQGDTAIYAAQPLDVSAWARRTGQTDEHLLDFEAYSRDFFDNTSRTKLLPLVRDLPLSDENKDIMLDYADLLNRLKFAGIAPTDLDHSPLRLWQHMLPQAFFTQYMQSLLRSAPEDMRSITVELAK